MEPNVAAMIHRHSSPARGWHRCKLQPVSLNGITQYNDKRFSVGRYKCKRTTIPALRAGWRQIAAATVGCTIFRVVPFNHTGYTSNLPPATYRLQPVRLNGMTRYTEPIVAAMIHRHSSPARGWHRCKLQPVSLNGITQYNDKRFSVGRYKCKRTTIPALRAGWRQIAAATVGCTIFGVMPFTPTG